MEVFGYAGYHTSLYYDYDSAVGYGDFYDTEAPSGYGYGGPYGFDYIHSNDATGLSYGKETGPNEDYFPTTATS